MSIGEFNVTGGQWNAIDLDMADFAAAGKALTDIFQIKFDTGSTPVSEFYVDNLAFTEDGNEHNSGCGGWSTGSGAFCDLGYG